MGNEPFEMRQGEVGIGVAAAEGLCPPEREPGQENESRRKNLARARTISVHRLSKRELALQRAEFPDVDHPRPGTRADCASGQFAERPCAFVGCKYHLFLDVNPVNGNIKLNFPGLEVEDLPETCSLDIADRGGITLEEVGALMNLTRERVRQVEVRTAAKLKGLRELTDLWGVWDI